MAFSLGAKERLIITIAISFSFFVAEITGQRARNWTERKPSHACSEPDIFHSGF